MRTFRSGSCNTRALYFLAAGAVIAACGDDAAPASAPPADASTHPDAQGSAGATTDAGAGGTSSGGTSSGGGGGTPGGGGSLSDASADEAADGSADSEASVEAGAADARADAGPRVLPELVVKVADGTGAGNEVRLLDGSGRSATTDDQGEARFTDVPVPYALAAEYLAGFAPQATMEVHGLTRADPVLIPPTGFFNVGNARFTGQASLAVSDAGPLPANCGLVSIVGSTAVGQLLASDETGAFSYRGLVWPGLGPLTTRLFGFYYCRGTALPRYLGVGFSDELVVNDGDAFTDVNFDVDTPVEQTDHEFSIDFEDLDAATFANLELWSATVGGERVHFAGTFSRALLAEYSGHTGTPISESSAVPTGPTSVAVRFGGPQSADLIVQIVKPISASGTTHFEASEGPRVRNLTPAARPSDVDATAPVLEWDPVSGADLVRVVVYQDGDLLPRVHAILPGDATRLDLATHYEMSEPLLAGPLTVTVTAFTLEGATADETVDGSGQILDPGGQGRMSLLDTAARGQVSVGW